MRSTVRATLAVITLALACVPLGLLFSSAPPDETAEAVLAILSGITGTAAACLWVVRFPTKRQSVLYALACSASIAMASLAQRDPIAAVLACTAFAAISGYIAIFHTGLLMTLSVIVILGVSAVPAMRLATTNGVVWASCTYLLLIVVTVAVPYGSQIIVYSLGVDAIRADRDPLTGLYTRQAFYERTANLLVGDRGSAHLIMAMIDLDRFKQLNDTRGHTEGDLVLAAVGRTLLELTPASAVIGRAGGEEFLAADVADEPRLDVLGQRYCDAVAALPHQITASVGIASIRCDDVVRDGGDALIASLIKAADAAMYLAKRNGGNQIRFRTLAPHSRSPGGGLRFWNPDSNRWEQPSSRAHPTPERVNMPRQSAPSANLVDRSHATVPIVAEVGADSAGHRDLVAPLGRSTGRHRRG